MGYTHFIPSSPSIILITCSLLIPIAFPIVDPPPSEDLGPPPPLEEPPEPDYSYGPPSIEDTELDYKCLLSNKPFTSNYSQSRALVLNDLISNTSLLEGFRNASYTWPLQGGDDEWTYGLALCRRDVSAVDCTTCVTNGTVAIIDTHHCPNSRAAIIWRNYCFIKYSDVDFFGTVDTDNKFTAENGDYWENNNSTNSVKIFKRKLSRNATESPLFYAQMMSNIKWDWVTVFGAAQCTRDLSRQDCKDCLDRAANNNTAANKKGATIAYGSCNLRYETYNFLKNSDF